MCALLLIASTAKAQPASDAIPEALAPWVPWVKAALGDQPCPMVAGQRTCAWPSTLALEADPQGARFVMRVSLDREADVTLPGSHEHWPQDVASEKRGVPVRDAGGRPQVRLGQGMHALRGRFIWDGLPDALAVDPNVGVVTLQIAGQARSVPRREADGLLWLAQTASASEEERLTLSVHRRLEDGVPLRIVTRIQVSASGKPREVVLRGALLAGTLPTALHTGLPAELAPDASLRLQVQPGQSTVELVAVRPWPTPKLVRPPSAPPWPDQELWLWQADDRFRQVEVAGAPQIDPARTDLAPDWRHLPTYVVGPGEGLVLDTQRRGEPEPPPNRLSLERTLWLDLDGRGYTVRDHLGGVMQRDFRLSLLAGELGRVVDHGVDQLITRHQGMGGVELRHRDVDVQAEWRLPQARRSLPAVGYDQDVDALQAELKLPPGFMLLGTDGVDQVEGTWLHGWNLFDFFFVLLVALAVGKVVSKTFGVLALLALVLTHHMAQAPGGSWVALLAFTALLQALPPGRFHALARSGWFLALAAWLVVGVPFAVHEVRAALYPHLAFEIQRGYGIEGPPGPEPMAPAAEPAFETTVESIQDEAGAAGAEESASRARMVRESAAPKRKAGLYQALRAAAPGAQLQPDPHSVVQTGPGLPSWHFRQFHLAWSGPVAKDQRLTLWILPPAWTRLWSLAAVLLSGLLLFALARAALRAQPRTPGAASAAGGALLVLLLALPSQPARAQAGFPPSELLEELRSRLAKPPPCEPECVSVARLSLRLSDDQLTLIAEVHASATGAYRTPGPMGSWAPDQIRVDGKDAFSAARLQDGFLYVRVEPGLHHVELRGPLPRSRSFTLALGTQPHRVDAVHPGFVVEGLRADGRAEASLSIRRDITLPDRAQAASALSPWLEVRRQLTLGVRFQVHTTVTRTGPAHDSVLARIPLLSGEEPTAAELSVDGRDILVQLSRGEHSRSFASVIAPSRQLTLKAPVPTPSAGGGLRHPFSEVWVVRPGNLYRFGARGLAPVSHVDPEGLYAPLYRPWPGEQITITAQRLPPAKGVSTTIDWANATYTPGARMESVQLLLGVRTSRGESLRVQLPQGATLSEVAVDDAQRPARVQDGQLALQLDPGSHRVALSLQQSREMGLFYRSPALAVGPPLTNVTSTIVMPDGRWLLWARGPSWGAAVLFWGYLVVALLIAWALGRIQLSPLKTYEWCLLAVGLTQVEAPVALIVVGWLFALAARERHVIRGRRLFNVGQLALVLLTLLALSSLASAVHQGLVVQPDMQVQGMRSSNRFLKWYSDRTAGALPAVSVWSVPLWVYKGLMLLWALWLAASVLRWLRWGFTAFRGGGSWRPKPPKPAPKAPALSETHLEAQLNAATSAPTGEPAKE